MKVALGTFACTGLRAHLGPDIAAGVHAALFHYTRRIKSGRAPLGLPPFSIEPAEAEVAVDLSVDEETAAILEQEAKRQGATVGQLAVHSVLTYLAELDVLSVPPRSSGGTQLCDDA